MKRSKLVDLPRFRKAKIWALAPLSLAIGAVLTGCSDSSEQVKFVTDVDDCMRNTPLDQRSCELAYQKALEEAESTSPKYSVLRDCEGEFGVNGCYQSTQGTFMPFMTGFLVSSALNSFDRNYYYHPVYTYRSSNRSSRVLSDGTPLFRNGALYTVPKDTMKSSKPKVTKTISRGGFGSKASAKSSWGSSRSSGSWGG
ncbi:DUF1190 domain-containing protein [Marinomonas fungiae]|uniref:DUF1190 domain-containing protein n=1 Tax=Marinomonas fungiae TaxID=1137284 RepID=UPI003A927128